MKTHPSDMIKKVLVTGSTGYVGMHLVPKLKSKGYEILEITRELSKSSNLFKDSTEKIQVLDSDLKLKIAEFRPDAVVHLASFLTSSDKWDDVEKLIETNIIFLTKILDAVSKVNLKLFINTGTFAEYFHGNDEQVPAYFYAATKTASRSLVDYYSNAYKFKQTTIVPYTVYGGSNSQKKIIDIIFESSLSDKALDLSPGEQVLDFIYIDDVVDFYTTVIKNWNNLPNKSNFKLGTGIGYNLKQLASFIEEISNRKMNINWGGKSYRNTDVMFAVADISSINKLFDWAPKVPLKKGIKLFLKNRLK